MRRHPLPGPVARRLGVGLVAACLLAACGGDDGAAPATTSSDPSVTTPTTAAPTTGAPTMATPTTMPTTTAAPTTVADTTTTTLPAPAEPSVLVASPQGIVRMTGDSSTIVTGEPASVAVQVDATVYFQSASGRDGAEDPAATAIRWIDPAGVKTLLTPGEGEFLRLHSGGAGPDGRPLLVYSVLRGEGPPVEDNPEPQQELLFVYDISTSTPTQVAEIGGWESGTSRLTLGGELLVGTWSSEASHGLAMIGLDGSDRADPAKFGLEASYDDCSDCPTAFTIDGAGALVAWVDTGVAAFADALSGGVLATLAVPDEYYSDAQVEGQYLVLTRPELPALLVDIATGGVTQLPAGTVTLLPS